jgi:hypothetical protein
VSPLPVWSETIAPTGEPAVSLLFENGRYGPDPVNVTMLFICGQESAPTYTAAHTGTEQWTITVTSSDACGGAAPPTPTQKQCQYELPDGRDKKYSSGKKVVAGFVLLTAL